MKNETALKKLTPAQAYAAQVKADRRAAALERQGVTVRNDNNRVSAMFAKVEQPAKPKAAKAKVTETRKYAPWGTAEYQFIVDAYLRLSSGGDVPRDEIIAAHAVNYPNRSEGAISYAVAHLKGLDVAVPGEPTLTIAEGLVIAAYEANPGRFPAGADLVEARLEAALVGLR
jgi:hypothetical protein